MSEKFSKKEQQKEKLLPDYLEEAKKIEEELDSMEDPWADDDEIEEKMRLRIYQGILEEQEKRRKKVSWVHRAGKYVAMVAITVIAIFSVSMTSQANRQRFLRSVSYMIGKDEVIEISNTDNLDEDGMEEEKIARLFAGLRPVIKGERNVSEQEMKDYIDGMNEILSRM